MLGVTPLGGAGTGEQVGDAVLFEVVPDGQVVGRADHVEQGEDPLVLDQPLGVGRGAAGLVAVVEGDELDLAAVDAPELFVHVVEVRLIARGDLGEGRERPRLREARADLDRVVGDALGEVTLTVVDMEVLGGLVARALGGGLVLLVTAGVLAATTARGGDQGQDRQQRDERA